MRSIVARQGAVVAYSEGDRFWVEAPIGAPSRDMAKIFDHLQGLGLEPGSQWDDEETEAGIRIRLSPARVECGALLEDLDPELVPA